MIPFLSIPFILIAAHEKFVFRKEGKKLKVIVQLAKVTFPKSSNSPSLSLKSIEVLQSCEILLKPGTSEVNTRRKLPWTLER